jgi:hypothetical protein
VISLLRKEVTRMEKWIFTILRHALQMASPKIIEDLRRLVADMMDRAEKTPNPWDDIIIGMIQMIVGKPGEMQRIDE